MVGGQFGFSFLVLEYVTFADVRNKEEDWSIFFSRSDCVTEHFLSGIKMGIFITLVIISVAEECVVRKRRGDFFVDDSDTSIGYCIQRV